MAQNCLKCLKYIMCAVNFLCFISGVTVLGFGVYMMQFQMSSLLPSLGHLTVAKMLLMSGIIITCISFLGFIGALKENRCFLLTFFILLLILMLVELAVACLLLVYDKEISDVLQEELEQGLTTTKQNFNSSSDLASDWDLVQKMFRCCGVHNVSDWGDTVPDACCPTRPCATPRDYYPEGCLPALTTWFNQNFLTTGIAVIVLCVIEVLGMCFSMTLFCHISRSGLGYKL